MRTQFLIGVAAAAIMLPGAAFAQSTGSTDFEGDIIITATTAPKGIEGIQSPDTSKAKGVLTQDFISKGTPGNSILDTINSLPGVSFQNNDPFGSAGGTLTIRGFDSSRISLTFDGIPLNDTGNYALYSNQQLDPELIEQVNVNYGSTDVDSPSAAASGSTVNYRTINPTDAFGVRLQGSVGEYSFMRIFGLVNTGVFTPWGTKAWFSASTARNDVVFNDYGQIAKGQYNGKIYQPIGSKGDFISISANYNVNRNNFFGSAPLRQDSNVFTQTGAGTGPAAGTLQNPTLNTGVLRNAGTNNSFNRFPFDRGELPYHIERCVIAPGVGGVADNPINLSVPAASNNGLACGTSFDERYNPSNTGSFRLNSRFTLAKGLVLTIDPSFQYTKANGGGTVTAREGLRDLNAAGGTATPTACNTTPNSATNTCRVGYFAGNPYVGKDLNGDGDLLDTVNLLAPSQTQTRRYGVIASLRYDITEDQTIRFGYTFDKGRHRQTGEIGFLKPNGEPFDVFPVNNGVVGSNGQVLQKRDRLSYATLHQVYSQYRGQFMDDKLTIELGVTAKFFKRDLTNYCFTSSAGGFVECFGRDATLQGEIATLNPYSFNSTTNIVTGFSPPQNRVYNYSRVLPSGGLTYKFMTGGSVFLNYSKGIQVPGTDNLYNAMYYPVTSSQANPTPETTDNFDLGFRYTSSKLQIQAGPWYTRFTNRLASAYDPDTQTTFYRNLGRVDKYGIDGSVSFKPIPEVTLYAFGSYLKSEIKNNVVLGVCSTVTTTNCTTLGQPIYALTAGKRESGSPVYSFGGRISGTFGPVSFGVQAKRTGPRYVNDQNLPNLQCTAALVNAICPTTANTVPTVFTGNTPTGGFTGTRGFQYQVFGAKTPAYTQVDLDLRVNMDWAGMGKKTFFQLNVQNLFNEFYVGGFSGGATTQYSVPFAQIGSPRAIVGTVNFQF